MTKETFLYGYRTLQAIIERSDHMVYDPQLALGKGVVLYNRGDVLDWTLQERKTNLLRSICDVAAEEKRLDILNEVFNNLEDEDDKISIFQNVDGHAARHGKLEALKWFDTKGLVICTEYCAYSAAKPGHLHILQWLREEKGLQLSGYMYEEAIHGRQLHVMKWFREQGFPWYERTFVLAVSSGNLDVLEWLHDEGCPRPDNNFFLVDERRLKPDVIHWCRMNGYGDRMFRA